MYASSDSSPDFETNSCVERLKKKPKLEDSMPVCTLEEESAELTSFKAPRMLFTPFPSTLNSKSFHQTSNDREGGIIVNVTHKTQKDSSDIVKSDSKNRQTNVSLTVEDSENFHCDTQMLRDIENKELTKDCIQLQSGINIKNDKDIKSNLGCHL